MSFRTKFAKLNATDILVIPECEDLEKHNSTLINECTSYIWEGENKNKGIGIFSFNGIGLKLSKYYNPIHKYIIPIEVTKNKSSFNLFAVWAHVNGNYTKNMHAAIEEYSELLNSETIIVGDFNSNKIWDKKPSIGNHSKTVELLKSKQLRSCYHEYYQEEFGEETKATFFMYHHQDKPYHIDYCFCSESFILLNFEVGDYDNYTSNSDHMPIYINLLYEG